jgi:hypothetical protein
VLLLQHHDLLDQLKNQCAMQATVIIAPTTITALVPWRWHGRVLACARIASSRSANHPTISVSISFAVAQRERHVFVGDVRVTTFHTHHRKTKRGVASLIDCHSEVSNFVRPAVSSTIANATRNRLENGEVLKARSGEARPDTSSNADGRL